MSDFEQTEKLEVKMSDFQQNEKIVPNNYYVKMQIDFGPKFSSKELTRKEFIVLLKDESKKYPTSFIGKMLIHFAEHMEAQAILEIDKATYLSYGPIHSFNSVYEGCGSCTTNDGSRGSSCLWWDDDGNQHSSCDAC